MNILTILSAIPGLIYIGLAVLNFLIVVGSVMIYFYSSILIFLFLGPLSLTLWLTTGRENIFKDKILRKILRYLTYAYIILTILALLPLFLGPSLKDFLVALEGCAIGYVGILLDAIILYYLYIKLRKYYNTLHL
ncbi:MAG: hypothetical protein RXQ77_04030 [Candidatus Nanopusillus sp.]